MITDELKSELYLYVMAILGTKPGKISNITKGIDTIYIEFKDGRKSVITIADDEPIDREIDNDIYDEL